MRWRFGRGKTGDLVIPWCTYTTPELAHVGISHEEAAKRGNDIQTVTPTPWSYALPAVRSSR